MRLAIEPSVTFPSATLKLIRVCSIFALLISGTFSLHAVPLTIAEARESVGKNAEITGTVITQTRGGDNSYLSFGGAYPRQTFTVQYNRDRVAHSEEMEDANGRDVVVAGEIIAGEHGPRMIIDDIRQITFLPVDEKVILAQPIDGAVQRHLYSLAWQQILKRGEFKRIEEQAAAFGRKEIRGNDGLLVSLFFYEGFTHGDDRTEESWTVAHDRLLAWRKAFPDSMTARLAEAGFMINYAWHARGDGWASTITREGSQFLASRLDKADKILSTIPQSQRCPFYFRSRLIVELGQGGEKSKVMSLLRESQKQCPNTAEPYFQVAYFLLPRWYGREGEWEDFLEKETKGDSPFQSELYARVVWAQSGFYTAPFSYSAIFKDSKASWAKTKLGFDQIIRNTPQSSWNLNSYARLAYTARDHDTCAALIAQINGHENMDVWLSWTNFQEIPDWLGTPEALDK